MNSAKKRVAYTAINIPKELADELKIWRQAFGLCQGRTVSYAEMFRMMLDDMDVIEPDVVSILDDISAKHPEIAIKIGKYGKKQRS